MRARLFWVVLLIVSTATVQGTDDPCDPVKPPMPATEFISKCGAKSSDDITIGPGYAMDLSNDEQDTVTQLFGTQMKKLAFPISMENNDKVSTIDFSSKKEILIPMHKFTLVNNKILAHIKGDEAVHVNINGDITVRGNRKLTPDAVEFIRKHAVDKNNLDLQEPYECGFDGSANYNFTGCESIYGNLYLTDYEHNHGFHPKVISGCLKLERTENGKNIDLRDFLQHVQKVGCSGMNEIKGYCLTKSAKMVIHQTMAVTITDDPNRNEYICYPEDIFVYNQTNCVTIKGRVRILASDGEAVFGRFSNVTAIYGSLTFDGVERKSLDFFPSLETIDSGPEPPLTIVNTKSKGIKFPNLTEISTTSKYTMVFENNNWSCRDTRKWKTLTNETEPPCSEAAQMKMRKMEAEEGRVGSSERKKGSWQGYLILLGIIGIGSLVVALIVFESKKRDDEI